MVYLHCGWPRTSTSSLQAALWRCKDRLAVAGMVYPVNWRGRRYPAHYGLYDMLSPQPESDRALDDFKRFIDERPGQDFLLSAEGFVFWLLSDERQEAMLRFLAAAQEVTPMRCFWTLRRIDDLLASLYLLRLSLGHQLPPPAEHFEGAPSRESHLFEGMRKVSDACDSVYVKYDATGAHNDELLEAFGIPPAAAAEIRKELRRHRLNASLSHKQAAALINLQALSARVGVELDGISLRAAIERGDFSFEGDRPCDLVDGSVKEALHERALAAARTKGFAPYVEFFGGDDIDASSSAGLGAEAFSEKDLKQLVDRLTA